MILLNRYICLVAIRLETAQALAMVKRVFAGVSWYVGTLAAFELVIYFTGGPHEVGPILGIFAALCVAIDPLHRIWTAQARRSLLRPNFNTVEPPAYSSQPI